MKHGSRPLLLLTGALVLLTLALPAVGHAPGFGVGAVQAIRPDFSPGEYFVGFRAGGTTMTEESKRKKPEKPKIENLELNRQPFQDLTAEEAEEAQGGVGLALPAPPRLPQKQPPQNR